MTPPTGPATGQPDPDDPIWAPADEAVEAAEVPPSERRAPRRRRELEPGGGFGVVVAALAAAGAAIRLAYAIGWRFGQGLQYDGPVYAARARFLVDGRGFIDPDAFFFHDRIAPGAIHPPGNALFLALGAQFGLRTPHQVQLWGCLPGVLTIVVVAVLAREVAGRRAGLIAAAVAAFHPGFWSYDPSGMAETPGQLLTALTLLAAYRFWRTPTPVRAAWLGGIAAAAALTRSELVILLPLLVLPLCVVAPGSGRVAARRVGAALLWAGMVLGPWVGWNLVRFERPVTLASGVDLSLAYAQCDATWYGPDTGYWNIFCASPITDRPANRNLDESELGHLYRKAAGTYIAEHRSRWPVVVAARVARTLSVYPPRQQVTVEHEREGRERAVLWAATGATWATYLLAAVAFARPPRNRRHLLPLLAPLVAGLAGAAITFGTSRYRSAGEVGLAVLAAVGVDALTRAWDARAPDAPRRPD